MIATTSLRTVVAWLALAFAGTALAADSAPAQRDWRFTAFLDGKPIGSHHFALEGGEGGARTLTSDARFDVKLLGLTVYRYGHHVSERWQGNCLAALTARTDDDGQVTDVRAQVSDAGLVVRTSLTGKAAQTLPEPAPVAGCVMSFAYWNPALRSQRRLLDPASGKLETVQIAPLPEKAIEVRGQPVTARGWRIDGLAHPIDVWYAGDEWIGLDTVVERGRRLSYRPS
ncbi:MAG: DUF6134 family protein [Rubrivivax sp.]